MDYIVPHDIMDSGITARAQILYIKLLNGVWGGKHSCVLNRELAEALGVTPRSIQKYLRKLEEYHLIDTVDDPIYGRVIRLLNDNHITMIKEAQR